MLSVIDYKYIFIIYLNKFNYKIIIHTRLIFDNKESFFVNYFLKFFSPSSSEDDGLKHLKSFLKKFFPF